VGRPIEFDQETADRICEQLTEGLSLRKICLAEDMPCCSTVYKWLTKVPEFAEQYAHARESQADTLADEIIDIADDGSNDWMGDKDDEDGTQYNGDAVARSRLRVEARKWVAAKLKPKKYGDKTLHGSDPENPLPPSFSVNLVRPTAAD
jgi:hypothetical protein